MEKKNNQIELYQSPDGRVCLEVNLKDETLWLTQAQMAFLFERDQSVISRHINNVFKDKELDKASVYAKFAYTASDGKIYEVEHYSLDVIISVGYRVKSKRGTQFRIWANKVLKDYLLQGYAINESRFKKQTEKIADLQKTLTLLSEVIKNKPLKIDEATGLLKVITDYTYALDLLDQYDHQRLQIQQTNKQIIFTITYKEACQAIESLAKQFKIKGVKTNLFGREKDNSFKGALKQIYQTFDGKELYPSLEEKGAHLLYFVIKDHPFVDGNKRIAAFLFIWFLDRNKYLYRPDGSKRIEDNALVAICLLIAQSKPDEKNVMVKLMVNLINKLN